MYMLHLLMLQPIYDKSVEYYDNRISHFSAQWGECAVTGKSFETLSEIHCHHIAVSYTHLNQNPPQQYVVYSTTKTESSHYDDHVSAVRTFVYLNLWSDTDPTAMALSLIHI